MPLTKEEKSSMNSIIKRIKFRFSQKHLKKLISDESLHKTPDFNEAIVLASINLISVKAVSPSCIVIEFSVKQKTEERFINKLYFNSLYDMFRGGDIKTYLSMDEFLTYLDTFIIKDVLKLNNFWFR